MSKIFEEALADIKKLKEVAEENAQKAILESVTPKIKKYIENQLLEQNDDEDFIADDTNAKDNFESLDESSIRQLMETLGINSEEISNEDINEAYNNLPSDGQRNLKQFTKKINNNKNLSSKEIDIEDENLIKELLMNKNRYYEVDLQALREAVDLRADELDADEELKREMAGMHDADEGMDMKYELDDPELTETLDELSEDDHDGKNEEKKEVEEMINEIKLALDLGEEIDEEMIPEELRGMIFDDEEEDEDRLDDDSEDLDSEELDSEDESEEDSAEEMEAGAGAELPPLEEVFDIDPNMLREELKNIRNALNEGNVDHHFGGKGGGNMGHKNAYGGKGPKKHGYQKSFGGGSYGQDAFTNPPSSLQKLNETIKKLRRTNRSQNEKLNKYRSAVKTLREQLEDLNLFNAKLLYVNKLLQNKGLNESQKKSVIKALDEARSIGETKALFKSLTESLSSKANTLNESTKFGSSSRATTSASKTNKQVGEMDRWAKLAGLK